MKTKLKITNKMVKDVIDLRAELKTHELRTQKIKEILDKKEKFLCDAISKGASDEKLKWNIYPNMILRRFPKWKELFIKYKSQRLADKILEKTKPVVYYNVKIVKKCRY